MNGRIRVRFDLPIGHCRQVQAERVLVRGAAEAVQKVEDGITAARRDGRREIDDREPSGIRNGGVRYAALPDSSPDGALIDQLERGGQTHGLRRGVGTAG
jgi:hypothetical protein